MSLHTLAQHLQSAGRGDDKVLVHMTPHEVSGLQSLAMAHGGSLTINPETGLPEAGFLSGILPMLAGAALTVGTGGAINPLTASMIVGGAGAVATGSLQKGLMMGLGAYGGSNLAAGLGGAAGAGAAAANISPAISSADAAMRAGQTIGGGFAPSAAAVSPNMPVGLASATGVVPTAPALPNPVNTLNAQQAAYADYMKANPVVASSTPTAAASQGAPGVESSIMDRLKTMGGNVTKLFGSDEADKQYRDQFLKENKLPLIGAGIAALSLSREEQKMPKEQQAQLINPSWNRIMQAGGNYQAGPYTGTSERIWRAADGGLADLPVEQMSQQASIGANTNYPMANIRPFGYAVPKNVPVSTNVFRPADYQRVDPYTGEQKLAGGGIASLVNMATGGFVSKLKAVEKPKETKPKLQDTAAIEKKVASLEKYSNVDEIQGKYADIQAQIKELSKDKKGNKDQLAQLNKQLPVAQKEADMAKQYKDAVANRDKVLAANQSAIDKAKQTYDTAMEKYQSYQDALAAEKKAWQEETTRKATGLQAVKPQTVTKAAIEEKEGTFTPKYVKDPSTGKLVESTSLPPVTEFKAYTKVPGFDPTKKILEEADISAVFEDVAGRRPTKAEMEKLLGTVNSQAGIAAFASKLPDVVAKVDYNDDDIKENWKYYIGREPTAGELANVRAQVKAGKITNFNQMRGYIQNRPQYLENINKVAQSTFTQQQQSAQEALQEQARAASKLTPEAVSTAYKDVLGRPPTMEELRQYMGAQQTQEGLAGMLKGSEEYLQTLTKPFLPKPEIVSKSGTAYQSESALPFTKYAPGTVLEYKPDETETGITAPATKDLLKIPGALYGPSPTFNEQLGIQSLASQAAEKAPILQTGLKFSAPQQQDMFGFQPYAQSAPAPQSIEAILAALRAQQQQGVTQMAGGGMAEGGYSLGDYSDGGRLLKGPGDGVDDQIPATIANKQPARLANNEFVIPARIVSELGNGSTDAGARKLYAMMERVQAARRKSIGKGKVAVDTKADRFLPA